MVLIIGYPIDPLGLATGNRSNKSKIKPNHVISQLIKAMASNHCSLIILPDLDASGKPPSTIKEAIDMTCDFINDIQPSEIQHYMTGRLTSFSYDDASTLNNRDNIEYDQPGQVSGYHESSQSNGKRTTNTQNETHYMTYDSLGQITKDLIFDAEEGTLTDTDALITVITTFDSNIIDTNDDIEILEEIETSVCDETPGKGLRLTKINTKNDDKEHKKFWNVFCPNCKQATVIHSKSMGQSFIFTHPSKDQDLISLFIINLQQDNDDDDDGLSKVCAKIDINGDGKINTKDFDDFELYMSIGSLIADLNGDGILNFEDYNIFLTIYESECQDSI